MLGTTVIVSGLPGSVFLPSKTVPMDEAFIVGMMERTQYVMVVTHARNLACAVHLTCTLMLAVRLKRCLSAR
jgi:hypothetical protein